MIETINNGSSNRNGTSELLKWVGMTSEQEKEYDEFLNRVALLWYFGCFSKKQGIRILILRQFDYMLANHKDGDAPIFKGVSEDGNINKRSKE